MLAAALRIIRADLRARPLNAFLTGLVVAFAVGALVVTLHGRATLDAPYDRLFDATNGAHVTVVASDTATLRRIAGERGVVASEGPRPIIGVPVSGRADGIGLIGLPRTRARIEDPLILEGRRIRGPGEVVLARGWAREHGVRLGATIGAGDRRLKVVGIGSTAGSERRRLGRPGRRPRAGDRASAGSATASRCGWRTPAHAQAFARRVERDGVRTLDWRTQRAQLTDDARRLLTILQTTTLLALLAAGFTLATAISGRVLASRRQVGLLRAIGLTPAQVTGVLVAHYLVLAALAAPFGLAAGALIAEAPVGRGGRLARRARVRGARRRAAGRLAADRAARRRRGHRAARVARRPRCRPRPRSPSAAGRRRAAPRASPASPAGCTCRSWWASAPRTRSPSAGAPR